MVILSASAIISRSVFVTVQVLGYLPTSGFFYEHVFLAMLPLRHSDSQTWPELSSKISLASLRPSHKPSSARRFCLFLWSIPNISCFYMKSLLARFVHPEFPKLVLSLLKRAIPYDWTLWASCWWWKCPPSLAALRLLLVEFILTLWVFMIKSQKPVVSCEVTVVSI